MKNVIRITYLVSSIILNTSCTSQVSKKEEFQGVITYSDTLYAKRNDLIDEADLNRKRGHIHKFYYKNGSYKTEANGTAEAVTIFRQGDSVSYTYSNGIDTLFVNNILSEKRNLDTLYFSGNYETILGNRTKELVKKMGKTTYRYYLDSSLYINPDNFKHFNFAYTNRFYQMTNSLPLKEEYESTFFKIKSIAIRIEHKHLDDSIFNLPNFPRKNLKMR